MRLQKFEMLGAASNYNIPLDNRELKRFLNLIEFL